MITHINKFLEKINLEYESLIQTNKLAGIFTDLNKESNKIIYSYNKASLPYNRSRNRYTNVLAPDDTLFNCDTYINANVINDIYILTQGPLANYMDDFYQMVFESNAKIILCLTNQIEKNKSKFDLYYDDHIEKNFHRFRVKVESKKVEGNIIIRNLVVRLVHYHFENSNEEIISVKNIVQIQYLDWPDFKPPSDIADFLKLFDIIDSISPACKESPLIIHCSAGIGRSGTFCTIHLMINSAQNNLIDISYNELILPKLILDLRKSRAGLVQTLDQFQFCYNAIIIKLNHLLNKINLYENFLLT